MRHINTQLNMIRIDISDEFKEEIIKIVGDTVREEMRNVTTSPSPKTHIKGIHELATYLKVSPPRAQKLKNEGVFPYFQDGRLILFDPDKVQEAMANYNLKNGRKQR